MLGRTQIPASSIAHGLWGMGSWTDSDDQSSLEALQLSADLGCNFYDSAWAYGEGRSDGLLGKLLAKNPGKRLYAASKVPPLNGKWPARAAYKYEEVFPGKHVLATADQIRKQLGRDTIDLLQFHVWDDSWAENPDFRSTVERLKRDKIVQSFGLSLNRWQPENGLRAIATGLVDSVQVIYNIFDQAPRDQLVPACREKNIGVIARVPLDEGSLGGKLTLETRFPANDWRANYFGPKNLGATVERVEKIKALLASSPEWASWPLPDVALRFILSTKDVSTTIVGMRKPEHVRANMAAVAAGPLPKQLLQELKKHRWDRRP